MKECYFHLDAVPSHAYQRLLYKYPQRAFPYGQLLDENRRRGPRDPEFELIDTGVFDDGRYFDVVIEVAKEDADSLVIRITAHNRGPDRAPLHLIPQLWFRNTWSWSGEQVPTPSISMIDAGGLPALLADDTNTPALAGLLHNAHVGPYTLEFPAGTQLLFTDNETNGPRVWGPGAQSRSRYVKDAFHRHIVNGEHDAVNPSHTGTKACGWLRVEVDPGASHTMSLRLKPRGAKQNSVPPAATPASLVDSGREPAGEAAGATLGTSVDNIIALRRAEADEFYNAIHPPRANAEERNVQRQAFAGILWSKQSYLLDVDIWLDGDDPNRPPPDRAPARTQPAGGAISTRCASSRCRTNGSTRGSRHGTSRSTPSSWPSSTRTSPKSSSG